MDIITIFGRCGSNLIPDLVIVVESGPQLACVQAYRAAERDPHGPVHAGHLMMTHNRAQ